MKKGLLIIAILIVLFVIALVITNNPHVKISVLSTDNNGSALFLDKDTKEEVKIFVNNEDGKKLSNIQVGYVDGKGFKFFQLEDPENNYLPLFDIFPHNSSHSFTMSLTDQGPIVEQIEPGSPKDQAYTLFDTWFSRNPKVVDLGIKTLKEWDEIADAKISVVSMVLPRAGGKLKIIGTIRDILRQVTPDAPYSNPDQEYHIYSLLPFDGITSELYRLEEVKGQRGNKQEPDSKYTKEDSPNSNIRRNKTLKRNKNDHLKSGIVKDIDGNKYNTIKIGTRTWMAENLKTTKLNNGTELKLAIENSDWQSLTTSGYCWYNNDPENSNEYGAIYNWYAIENDNICPDGWHISTEADWKVTANYLGGMDIAGEKMKESGISHWKGPNTNSNNISGFTALPGGARNYNGVYDGLSYYGCWWIYTPNEVEGFCNDAQIDYNSSNLFLYYGLCNPTHGFSIRCVKDLPKRTANTKVNRISIVKEIISLAKLEDFDRIEQYLVPFEALYSTTNERGMKKDSYFEYREREIEYCIREIDHIRSIDPKFEDKIIFEDVGSEYFTDNESTELKKDYDISDYGDVNIRIKLNNKSYDYYMRLLKYKGIWYFSDFDRD